MKPERNRRGRERLLLCCGFGLSTSLVVGALGLRWPVLLPGLLPPLASLGVWHWAQRRLHQPAAASTTVSSCLFDAVVLQDQLRLDAELGLAASVHWQHLCQSLHAVRQLAHGCAELDPGCSVALLVLLEGLVHRAQALEGDLCRLGQANPGNLLLPVRRLSALQEHLQACQAALSRCYEVALEEALQCPDVPPTVVLSPLLLES